MFVSQSILQKVRSKTFRYVLMQLKSTHIKTEVKKIYLGNSSIKYINMYKVETFPHLQAFIGLVLVHRIIVKEDL